MYLNLSALYKKWISKGEYKKALDFLKINPHLDASKTLYFEIKKFENPSDSKEIIEKLYYENMNRINHQLKQKEESAIKPIHPLKRRSLAQLFYRKIENKN